ncbi:MAG: tetrahydrofolate dehydrogenase/cyclohydrolase catalytic domain-containing protein, partial [Burkholderiales bacterium]
MTLAQRIDGHALSQQIRADIARRAAALKALGRPPGLAVILVGEDPASQVYVRNKIKACEDNGLHSVLEKYDANLTESGLLDRIAALNTDPCIHGILVQMPLPGHINPHRVIESIATHLVFVFFFIIRFGELLTCMQVFMSL